MLSLFSVLCFLLYYQTYLCEEFENDTELLSAVLVHRHGDRTPTESRAKFTNDLEKLKELIEPYGYGQLTETGLQRSYKLGEFIRKRYNALLSPRYKGHEVSVHATDSHRTQMSALAVMAAVYPPTEPAWRPNLNWTPTPYTTVPKHLDYNIPTTSCPKYAYIQEKLFENEAPELSEYADVYDVLTSVGHNFTNTPTQIIYVYDTFVAQLGLGLPLDPRINGIYPRLKLAAEKAFDIVYGNEETLSLSSGPIINDFLRDAENKIAGRSSLKMRIISGHDLNVYQLAAISRVQPRPKWPGYGAAFALELRKTRATGKYVVLAIYLPSPDEKLRFLKIKGCDSNMCDFYTFRNLTLSNTLNETEWKIRCDIKSC